MLFRSLCVSTFSIRIHVVYVGHSGRSAVLFDGGDWLGSPTREPLSFRDGFSSGLEERAAAIAETAL